MNGDAVSGLWLISGFLIHAFVWGVTMRALDSGIGWVLFLLTSPIACGFGPFIIFEFGVVWLMTSTHT